MKKLISFLLAAVLLLGMAACQSSKPDYEEQGSQTLKVDSKDDHPDYQGISVQVEDIYLEDGKINLAVVWSNDTKYDAIFGASYVIERYDNGEWVDCAMHDEMSFIDIAYELKAGKNQNETYNLTNMYDVSKAGVYRFRTTCSVHTGSGDANNITLWAEFTLSEGLDKSQIKAQETVNYGVQYIRTDGYRDGAAFPRVEIIRSVEELKSYYEANKDIFDLARRPDPGADSTKGFLDACDKYDAAYFENGYLVFVLLEEGSGSVRHEVEETTISSNGELGIYISTKVPEIGTCDMAEWHIILEMSNVVEVKDENTVQVYLNGRLAYDKGPVASQAFGTQSPVIFKAPPAAKLLHGNGSTPVSAAGFSWMYPNGDGTMAGAIADARHPLLCQDILNPIYVSDSYVKLDFEDEPDSVEIRCWPDTAWNDSAAVSETVTCYGTAFDLKQGGYIYEITAKWNKNETAHYGSASYYAYIVSGYSGSTRTT